MNLFLLLGWVLFLGILGALVICFVVLLITAWAKRSRKLALWATLGTAAAALVVVGIFVGAAYLWLRPYDPTTPAELQNAYKADFGALPPTGVTVLKSRQVVIADSGGQWLLLKATSEEIDRHIAMGFRRTEAPPSDFRGDAGANAPAWWQPPTGRLELYENLNWSKAGGWHSSQATMGVDRGSNLIWFATSKCD